MPVPDPFARPSKHDLAALRQEVARLERGRGGPPANCLALGVEAIDRQLPGGGLSAGVLHEIVAGAHADQASAFGFAAALASLARTARRGPAVLVLSRRALAETGFAYGHGLARLGLDLERLLLVEARNDRDALWALEEALRFGESAGTAGGTVMGALGRSPDLTQSRRLNLAAGASGTPLLLLRTPQGVSVGATATRWRIQSAAATRDRFGAFAGCRWDVTLERCRNGRPGRWLIEWDHGTHSLRLAEIVARRAPAPGAGEGRLLRLAS